MILSLLVGMLASSGVRLTRAVGSIYIRDDGSIDPQTASISSVDNFTYTLTSDIDSETDGIVVERNNIVIDGNGHMLQGSSDPNGVGIGNGIVLSGRENVTVQNIRITLFGFGIRFESSSNNNNISENNITNNVNFGIVLDFAFNNSVKGNNITNNNYGIVLFASSNNSISENNISNNDYGMVLDSSSNNCMSGNNMTANFYHGIFLYSSSNSIVRGNIIGPSIGWDSYGIRLSYSFNNTVKGNSIIDNGYGIFAFDSSGSRFWYNNFIGNDFGQVYTGGGSRNNTWDNGVEGNYWSDYTGVDSNGDGIGDVPRAIDENNTDRYPLVFPFEYLRGPDINHDGMIDVFDLVGIALAYGSVPGMPNWNTYVDLNQDNEINMLDLVMVAIHFGEQWTTP